MSNQLEELRRSQDVREKAVKGLADTHPAAVPMTRMKDGEITAMVNSLRDIARQFHDHGSLRDRIANVLVPVLKAEAKTDVPVVKNGHMVMVDSGALQMVRNALRRDAGNGIRIRAEMLAALDAATHPAPGVPDDVARDAERYRWLRSLEHCNEAWCLIGSGNANSNLDAAIDAAMLTPAQAQKSTDPQDTYVNGLAQANNEQD